MVDRHSGIYQETNGTGALAPHRTGTIPPAPSRMNTATVQNKCRHRTALFDHKQGGVTSREIAAEVGVEASVVRNWKRQLLSEPVPEDVPVRPGEVEGREDAPGGECDMVSTHDCDASGLEELAAERDRARAELERLRREKREVEIELAILKGAVELAGIRAGRRPGQPD